jgi:transposase, IS5 family
VYDEGKEHKRDIAILVFNYKNHASIYQRHGFVRGWTVKHDAAYDGALLRNMIRRPNTSSTV